MKSLYESILDDEDVLISNSIKDTQNPFITLANLSDEELKNTFNRERGIISRLINSCYVAMIEYQNEEIGFVMIVNNQITSKNQGR